MNKIFTANTLLAVIGVVTGLYVCQDHFVVGAVIIGLIGRMKLGMDDDICKIPAIMRIARKTLGIVRGNVVFALAVKLLILALSAIGLASMWAAVFGDVGVCILCILNSMRALRVR